MELYTMNRSFIKRDVVDEFLSVIWTERYYGDSAIEMVVPASSELIKKLPVGTFLGLVGSEEVMILESWNIEDGKLKVSGISLMAWLNNRFVRTSAKHEDQYWYISGESAGWVLWAIVYYMCVVGSPFLNGSIDTGITNPEQLAIPGLGLRDYDQSGGVVSVGIPFGPVYNAMKDIATTYQVGMQITLDSVSDTGYSLGFRSYKGLDRTSNQTLNSAVRFSPQMDSFTNIKELQSIAALKTLVYAFAPGFKAEEGQPVLTTVPGVSALTGSQYTGFDLRAQLVFASDITTDQVGGDPAHLVNILNSRAHDELTKNHFVQAVDGEIVPESQFQYGTHYNLGDIIEVQGNSGAVQTARITEYIRSQDPAGEKAYPTVTMIG
jgi:hypothetical protein